MDAPGARHKNILSAGDSLLLVIDVQERFRPHIAAYEELVGKICVLLRAAETLELPVVISEQYTRGLGPTVSQIKELERPEQPWKYFEKNCFSAAAAEGFAAHLQKVGRKNIIVCGIETHVCVNQTVHELLHLGYNVHVVTDAVASRSVKDREAGLQKMFGSGAIPATVEMALFEMLVEAGTARFKQVQSLVK